MFNLKFTETFLNVTGVWLSHEDAGMYSFKYNSSKAHFKGWTEFWKQRCCHSHCLLTGYYYLEHGCCDLSLGWYVSGCSVGSIARPSSPGKDIISPAEVGSQLLLEWFHWPIAAYHLLPPCSAKLLNTNNKDGGAHCMNRSTLTHIHVLLRGHQGRVICTLSSQ